MRLVVRYVLVAGLAAFGTYLIVQNHTAPSTPILFTSGGSVLLAGLLADPADVKAALASLVQYLPLRKPPSGS